MARTKTVARSTVRQGNTITSSMTKVKTKGNSARKVVKTTQGSNTTDLGAQSYVASGTKNKKVYKNGVLVKNKTRKMGKGPLSRI